MAIIREIKDINRFRQIVSVLLEEGFFYLIEKIKLGSWIRFKKKNLSKEKIPAEVRLRKTLERLGPTFIKLGQILSLRPDLVPKEYVKELGKLQDDVPAFPYDKAEKIIKEELGKPIDKIFSSFSKKPIASASISQVYRAKLKNGKIVAVKVQRPNVKKIMDTDIEIMFYIAKLLEKHSDKIRKYRPVKIVEEFKEWTDKELDFELEANNAKRFYDNFKGSNTVKIPQVFDDYSSPMVLTTEIIDGIELTKIDAVK